MSYDEALAWIRGERSMTNAIPAEPRETLAVRVAQADAWMMQQAYFVLKAWNEELVKEQDHASNV